MIKKILLLIIALLIVYNLLIYVFQRKLLFHPSLEIPKRQDYQALDMHQVFLRTQDGLTLQSWYKKAAPKQPTVLIFHGNTGNIGTRMGIARPLLSQGFGVLLLEYRGFGGNPGSPSEQGLYEDGRAAIRFLERERTDTHHMVLYGESLGTGVATKMATEYPVCAVVLQSPYTSMAEVARYHYPLIFLPPYDHFDSITRIRAIQAPLLIVHGDSDKVVPFQEGLALYNAANEPKQMVRLHLKHHNDLLTDPKFMKAVIGFIRAHCV